MQTRNVVRDDNPEAGFAKIARAGFSCADFSLNDYLMNNDIYDLKLNDFFDKSVPQLEVFFAPHKEAAKAAGISIIQMHMPYPVHIPYAPEKINAYLSEIVAPKSLAVCAFFECPYIVIHGFKLADQLGSEEAEWEMTERFLRTLAPIAAKSGITLCVENLYSWRDGPCVNAGLASERIDKFNAHFGAEVLGFCFDTGHANMLGLDFEEFITVLDNRLKVLHVHDNDGWSDLHQIPFTFPRTRENKSATDWQGFINGLRNIKYKNVINFETAPVLQAFPEALKEDVLAFIAKIGAYFAERIETAQESSLPDHASMTRLKKRYH